MLAKCHITDITYLSYVAAMHIQNICLFQTLILTNVDTLVTIIIPVGW